MPNSYGYKVSNSTESILLVSNNNHYASLVSLSARIRSDCIQAKTFIPKGRHQCRPYTYRYSPLLPIFWSILTCLLLHPCLFCSVYSNTSAHMQTLVLKDCGKLRFLMYPRIMNVGLSTSDTILGISYACDVFFFFFFWICNCSKHPYIIHMMSSMWRRLQYLPTNESRWMTARGENKCKNHIRKYIFLATTSTFQ